MRAIVVDAFGAAPALRDVSAPQAPPDGVVIDVRATGLCRSDWHGWAGHDPDIALPHVPGHEFAGVVSEVGADVRTVRVGDRVTAPFVCACGTCGTCRAGAPQVCERQYQPGFTGWGSFAEQVALPRADHNVVHLPDALDFATAASLGCRFATAYRAITAHARVGADDHVVVLGCGGVGLAAIMIAAARGARVVAVDRSTGALQRAKSLGATTTVQHDDTDPAATRTAVTSATGGAHACVDALGHAAFLQLGLECLRPRGRYVQVGLMVGADAFAGVPMARVIAAELEIYGSHGMAAADYPAMLAEIAGGRLRPDTLVAEHSGLEDLAGADGRLATMDERPPVGVLVVEP